MTGNDLVNRAREYLGTPFHHCGRLRGVAIDCVGLLVCVVKDLGVSTYDNTSYSRAVDPGFLFAELEKFCDEIYIDDLQSGDVLVFRTGRVAIQHVAFYTGKTLIHAYEPDGRVVEIDFDLVWRRRVARAYRCKGLT